MISKRRKRSTDNHYTEHWLNDKWRPMMGWMYMAICTFDFMVAPILWSLLQARDHGMITSQWQPLTLQGAGLFHLAMGAVLGISAYGRTQEKLNDYTPMSFPQGAGTTYIPPGGQLAVNQPPNFSNNSLPQQPNFNNSAFPQPSFNSTPSSFTAQLPAAPILPAPVMAGFAGKKAPVLPSDPII